MLCVRQRKENSCQCSSELILFEKDALREVNVYSFKGRYAVWQPLGFLWMWSISSYTWNEILLCIPSLQPTILIIITVSHWMYYTCANQVELSRNCENGIGPLLNELIHVLLIKSKWNWSDNMQDILYRPYLTFIQYSWSSGGFCSLETSCSVYFCIAEMSKLWEKREAN